jgi:hypothetical protein
MSISTASRFSVLKDDVDESAAAKKKAQATKQTNVPKNQKGQAGNSKPKPVNLFNFQANANTATAAKKKSKPKTIKVTDDQWDAWQEKDQKMMDKQYEKDLESALLENRDDNQKSKNKKKAKPSVIPLESFLDSTEEVPKAKARPAPGLDDNTLKEIQKGVQDIFRMDNSKPNNGNSHDNADVVNVRLLEYQEVLLKKDLEIKHLQDDLEKYKAELTQVKLRNKKLCNILGSGEMREKAEILLEVDKLTQEKTDLSAQVAQLHTNCEQERSKVHNLQNELKKSGGARKRTDSANK